MRAPHGIAQGRATNHAHAVLCVEVSALVGKGGAMLLAVCRGRLSEGVDFADAACRAVVITGP